MATNDTKGTETKTPAAPENASAIIAPDRKALCDQWLTQTEEGKAYLRSKLPSEIFMYGDSLPGNSMHPADKPKISVHHNLGFHMTEHEAKAGLKNRVLSIIPIKRAE